MKPADLLARHLRRLTVQSLPVAAKEGFLLALRIRHFEPRAAKCPRFKSHLGVFVQLLLTWRQSGRFQDRIDIFGLKMLREYLGHDLWLANVLLLLEHSYPEFAEAGFIFGTWVRVLDVDHTSLRE